MKKIALVLITVLFFVACSSKNVEEPTVTKTDENGGTKSENIDKAKDVQKSAKVEKVEKPDVAMDIVKEKDFLVEADSVLVDETNIGFNYEPAMATDQDF